MKKFLLTLALIAALGASSVYADRNDRIVRRYDERNVYQDSRGPYHWQVVEREVWVPTRRVGSVLGSRVIPGHYTIRTERIKVYHNTGRYSRNNPYYDRDDRYGKGRKQHPHGMPPGQRKKYEERYGDRRNRDYDRDRDYRRDREYDDRDREYENRRSIPGQVLEEIRRTRGY